MDKAEILKLLEEWRTEGISSMKYRFSRCISAGHSRDEILKWASAQRYCDLLRRTKKALKKEQEK